MEIFIIFYFLIFILFRPAKLIKLIYFQHLVNSRVYDSRDSLDVLEIKIPLHSTNNVDRFN